MVWLGTQWFIFIFVWIPTRVTKNVSTSFFWYREVDYFFLFSIVPLCLIWPKQSSQRQFATYLLSCPKLRFGGSMPWGLEGTHTHRQTLSCIGNYVIIIPQRDTPQTKARNSKEAREISHCFVYYVCLGCLIFWRITINVC